MLNNPKLLALVFAGILAAHPAFSDNYADEIALQMARQGFADVAVDGTWLGRVRVTGTRNGTVREIIVNPNTGEILRDLWLNDEGQVIAADIALSVTEAIRDDAQDTVEDNVDARQDARDDRQDARDDRQDTRDDRKDD